MLAVPFHYFTSPPLVELRDFAHALGASLQSVFTPDSFGTPLRAHVQSAPMLHAAGTAAKPLTPHETRYEAICRRGAIFIRRKEGRFHRHDGRQRQSICYFAARRRPMAHSLHGFSRRDIDRYRRIIRRGGMSPDDDARSRCAMGELFATSSGQPHFEAFRAELRGRYQQSHRPGRLAAAAISSPGSAIEDGPVSFGSTRRSSRRCSLVAVTSASAQIRRQRAARGGAIDIRLLSPLAWPRSTRTLFHRAAKARQPAPPTASALIGHFLPPRRMPRPIATSSTADARA